MMVSSMNDSGVFSRFWNVLVEAISDVSVDALKFSEIQKVLQENSPRLNVFLNEEVKSERTKALLEVFTKRILQEEDGSLVLVDGKLNLSRFLEMSKEVQLPSEQDNNADNHQGKFWKNQKMIAGFRRPNKSGGSAAVSNGATTTGIASSTSSLTGPAAEVVRYIAKTTVPLPALRCIARLDIKGPHVVKGICMEGIRSLASPDDFAKKYSTLGADEILYIDLVASLYEKGRAITFLKDCMKGGVFIPLCVAGGIRSIEDISMLLRAGADKVAINTQAIKTPEFITEAAEVFGVQCIVGQIDCKHLATSETKEGPPEISSGWEALYDCGRERSYKDVVQWARTLESLGCGELLITSVDKDGTMNGCDMKLCRAILDAVSIPVVLSGGIGSLTDIIKLVQMGDSAKRQCSGIAVASALHYEKFTMGDMKKSIQSIGLHIRREAKLSQALDEVADKRSVAIVDYGVGNLASVVAAVKYLGFPCEVTHDLSDAKEVVVILPGVGAFQKAMLELDTRNLIEPLKAHVVRGGKLLGICLGAQLLLESSEEFGHASGLKICPGKSIRFAAVPSYENMSVPHIGWSRITKTGQCCGGKTSLFGALPSEMDVYFDHSYHFDGVNEIFGSNYAGRDFPAAFASEDGRVVGMQFHPEKSGDIGLEILRNFLLFDRSL